MAAYAHYAFMYGVSAPGMPPLAEQQASCRAHYETVKERYGWGGEWVDTIDDVSVDWRERPRGSVLFQRLQAGDLLIASVAGCIFKTPKKSLRELEILAEKGVQVVLLDEPAPAADRVEWIEWMARSHNRWAFAMGSGVIERRVRKGSPPSARTPYGWKPSVRKGRLTHIPDHHERRWAREFVRLKDEEGLGRDAIYWHMRKRGAKRSDGKEWEPHAIERAINAARKNFPNRWVKEVQA